MRITCDVDVANRLLPSFNMRGDSKRSRCQLSVGRKIVPIGEKEGEVCLMICSKQDMNGNKYKVKGNIENFFTKFIREGKSTIRFKEPPHDICLSKADPIQLKGLLSVLKMACQGQGLDKIKLTTLAPPTSKQVEKLKRRMTITTKRDYPITTNFPNSLEYLNIYDCSLKRIDTRVLQLRNLVRLDLSRNHIRSLPDDFTTSAPLSELVLADNHLEDIPAGFWCGSLSKTLTLLDLSQNKLKVLKPQFCKLQSLSTLRLEKNQLVYLPTGINQLQNLRIFHATSNQLRTLPGGFTQLRLDNLDIGENPFLEDGPAAKPINRLHVPSLLEWAARTIATHRIPYSEEDVGPLTTFLSASHRCLCGHYCFRSHVHYLARVDLRRVATNVTAIDALGRTHVPCENFLCSQTCFDRYKKNPYATIWK